ncbi:cell division cycle-associated protein 4 [Bufo bufo]|uniref:cell division cycle-associated protein 4 n=1 Tax=Bufo bufo TaxID=8384 RepID=UPI001ABDC1C0|nr:cell division cycle-associated protein 4 [Bufo bufo]XP_040268728.1 cell division cycle-associated protein 4 [Bufo bufo]XP_040268729.1 cell division cycle-associated protein 4 [Bufo bufo]
MFTRGMKRKCFDPEAIDGSLADVKTHPSYTLERQSMLDMSLVKLQLCHMLVEPNLCRSVLIANTVRQIQEEMTQDGSWQIFYAQQIDPPAPSDRLVSTEILCRSSKDQAEEKCPEEAYITYSEELDVQETQEISELSTVPSVKVAQNAASGFWEEESPQENRANLQKSIDHIFETLEGRNTNSMEDLFSEVDTSYYDLDTVLTGMMGNSKLGHCDVLESLSQSAAPTHCKAELNEIDHVVEILVES